MYIHTTFARRWLISCRINNDVSPARNHNPRDDVRRCANELIGGKGANVAVPFPWINPRKQWLTHVVASI